MDKKKVRIPTRDRVPLDKRWTLNRVELASITGCSVETVNQWIHEGIPCFRQNRMFVFERTTALEWLRKKALSRQGLHKQNSGFDDIFPGIELA